MKSFKTFVALALFASLGFSARAQLVGHWPFDQDSRDYVNNHHAQLYEVSFSKQSQIGSGALKMGPKGISRSAWLGNFQPSEKDFSIALWVKPSEDVQGHQTLISKRTAYREDALHWQFLYGTPRTDKQLKNEDYDYLRFESIISTAEFPYHLTDEKWTHIVLTYELQSKSVNLYLNGNLHHASPQKVTLGNVPDARMVVGGPHPEDWREIFNGEIDDVGIWSNALSPAQVRVLFQLGTTSPALNAGETQTLFELYQEKDLSKKIIIKGWDWSYTEDIDSMKSEMDDITVLRPDLNTNDGLVGQPSTLNQQFEFLFNGKDLDNWHTFLKEKGLDNDPEGIFSITEGATLKISGKKFGYIYTKKEYENFHLSVDFKWGEAKYAPREHHKRDSGILYNIPHGTPNKLWPKSLECQVQEGDCGDIWLLGGTTIQSDSQRIPHPEWGLVRLLKTADNEKPHGQWNRLEVISKDGVSKHYVNGQLVNQGTNASSVKGRIALQSEGAEVYYRNIKIRKL